MESDPKASGIDPKNNGPAQLVDKVKVESAEPVLKLREEDGPVPRFQDMVGMPAPATTENDLTVILSLAASHPWVFAGVSRIASAIFSVRTTFFRRGVDGKFVRSEDTDLEKLLERPNPFQTYEDLLWLTVNDLVLVGWSFWEKSIARDESINGVWRLRPDRIRIINDDVKYWQGITYERKLGEKRVIPPDELVPFRQWSPLSEYWGISGPIAAQGSLTTDLFARTWNQAFFRNGAVPDGTFETESRLDEDTYRRLDKMIKNRHGHPNVWRKPMILDSGLKFNETTRSQRDMQFAELMAQQREEILAALGIPPAMVGIPVTGGGLGGFREQRFQFYQVTILPLLKKIEATINRFLAREDEKMKFDLNDILSLVEDLEARTRTAESLVTRGIQTINEVRNELGLKPVPWGDEWHAPLGLAPVGAPGRPERPDGLGGMPQMPDAGPATEPAPPAEGGVMIDADNKLGTEVLFDFTSRRDLTKVGTRTVRPQMEVRIQSAYRRAFAQVKQDILQGIRDAMAAPKQKQEDEEEREPQFDFILPIFPIELVAFAGAIAEVVRPSVITETNRAGRVAAQTLGVEFRRATEENEILQNSLDSWLRDRLGSTARTFSKRVAEIAEAARAEGLSREDAMRRIETRIDELIAARIEDLAKSDATTFSTTASLIQAEGRFAFKGWVDLGDIFVRNRVGGESHTPANFPSGAVVPLDQDFEVPGRGTSYKMNGPGDPRGGAEVTSKCRCGLIFLTEAEAQALGLM